MRKRWLTLAVAGMLSIAPCLGVAEEVFDATRAAPLLNAITSAALGAEETVESIVWDEALTAEFAARLLAAMKDAGLATEAALSDPAALLGSLVAMPLPELTGATAEQAAVERLALRVLTADVNEDGDAVMLVGEVVALEDGGEPRALGMRAVVELRADEASPVGWKLYQFTLNDGLLLEAVAEGYFTGTMVEYMNAACGYSIQYPAIFAEELIVEGPTGIQAALPDDSASFSVARLDNVDGLDLDALLRLEQETNPLAQTSLDEMTGSGRSVFTDEEGMTHVAIFLVSGAYIYQAELNYPEAQAASFAQYADYMRNSFSADELGLG